MEITGIQDDQIILNPLYVFKETKESRKERVKGRLEKVGELIHTYKMETAGLDI